VEGGAVITVEYEWVLETLDENGDVGDVDHPETYEEALFRRKLIDGPADIGVVKNYLSADGSTVERAWAYVREQPKSWAFWALPEFFEDSRGRRDSKVPQRFHAEVASASR
jgi:hypothetical protein